MIHSLKVYAVKGIADGNKKIDYNEVPQDLHEFTKDFIKFFKVSKFINNNILFFAIAVDHGYLEVVKYFYESGTNISANDDWVLRLAAERGHLNIVKYFVENGADISARDDEALRWTAYYGYLEVVKYLVEKGADISANNNQALVWATQKNHLDVVKYLIENGANKDNALMCAAVNNQLEIAKYLVEHEANIHANNNWALNAAAYLGHQEIVKYLKSKMN